MDSPFRIPPFLVEDIADNSLDGLDEEDFEEEIGYLGSFHDDYDNTSQFSVNTLDIDMNDVNTDNTDHYDDHEAVSIYSDDNSTLPWSPQTRHGESSMDESSVYSVVDSDVEEITEPEPKRRRLDTEDDQIDDDTVESDQKCPICLAGWTSVGNHRLCSLKCGHLFGLNCIKQWLNSNNESANKCPQCNARASVRHIRLIYAKKVSCQDNTRYEKVKKDLDDALLRESRIAKALEREKKKSQKYKRMYKARMQALAADSDLCISD
ncbi:hypothetical protein QAD02_006767 [Eretmocerus hayati]|uniref:Uncharacterized protein n=1 Tax=Eretmocerus hayati TaxID=131215 RepID=A0ACC2N1U1_9HYME|nr:hypothetical protein QAD02_006767 [Eretmocerus hayati]